MNPRAIIVVLIGWALLVAACGSSPQSLIVGN